MRFEKEQTREIELSELIVQIAQRIDDEEQGLKAIQYEYEPAAPRHERAQIAYAIAEQESLIADLHEFFGEIAEQLGMEPEIKPSDLL